MLPKNRKHLAVPFVGGRAGEGVEFSPSTVGDDAAYRLEGLRIRPEEVRHAARLASRAGGTSSACRRTFVRWVELAGERVTRATYLGGAPGGGGDRRPAHRPRQRRGGSTARGLADHVNKRGGGEARMAVTWKPVDAFGKLGSAMGDALKDVLGPRRTASTTTSRR